MTAPLVGWRAWSLHDNQLVGATGWPWTSHIRRAWCATWHGPGVTDVPFDHCVCGLYAYKDRSFVVAQAGSIWGQVSLWGQVAIHETGYRAEWARIDRLWTRNPSHKDTLLRVFPSLHEDPDGGLVFLDDALDAELQILMAQAEWAGYGLEKYEKGINFASLYPPALAALFSGGPSQSTGLCWLQVPVHEGRTEVAVPQHGRILTGLGVICPCDGYVELIYGTSDIRIAFDSRHRKWVSLVPDPGLDAPVSIRFTLPRSVYVAGGTQLTVFYTIEPPHPRRPW